MRIVRTAGDIGDDVIISLSGRVVRGLTDGMTGTVVDFEKLYYTPANNHGRGPGVFYNYRHPTVRVGGKDFSLSSDELSPMPGAQPRSMVFEKIHELPNARFWEDDVVEAFDGRAYRIEAVGYREIETGSSEEVYTGSPMDGGDPVRFSEYNLALIERGNVYLFYNGLEPEFASISEEAAFYTRIGRTTQVRNESAGIYAFTFADALEVLKSGEGDLIWSLDPHVDKETTAFTVYSFKDKEIGDRYRAWFFENLETDDLTMRFS